MSEAATLIQLAQLMFAGAVATTMYVTFFRPKSGEFERLRQTEAAKQVVRSRTRLRQI